jgi:hypothetical protein
MPSHEMQDDAQNPLELNKETLQDLDVEAKIANGVKGGAGESTTCVGLSGPHVAPTDPYLITPYKGASTLYNVGVSR